MVYQWLQTVRSWLYPNTCILCGADGYQGLDLCLGCQGDLVRNEHACLRCAAPLQSSQSLTCGLCQHTPPQFNCVVAPYLYQPPLDFLIQQLKFSHQLHIARLLGELFAQHLKDRQILPDFLVPVPLHPKRLRQRGFNQSLEISKTLGRRLGVRVDYRLAKRVRSTATQSLLPAKQRHTNVRDAFQVHSRVKGLRLVIVDDVMTTGHTVNELAQCLLRAGARSVEVWVVSRAG